MSRNVRVPGGSGLPAGHGSLPAQATRFLQRARILDATAQAVAEAGYAGTSVDGIRTRAGVSARTFYEHFRGKEDAALLAFEEAAGYAVPRVVEAFRAQDGWIAGLDAALGTYLAIMDRDRAWAVLCLVELPLIGTDAAARRRALLAPLAGVLRAAPGEPPPLAPSDVIAAIDGVLRMRLVGEEHVRLQDLRDELLALVLGLHLGPEEARRWIATREPPPVTASDLGRAARADELVGRLGEPGAQAPLAAVVDEAVAARDGAALWRVVLGLHARRLRREPVPWPVERRALEGLQDASFFGMPVRDMRGRGWSVPTRVEAVLGHLAEHPGATSQEVREAIGAAHLSQVTRLLATLRGNGLVRVGPRRGRANAWVLTEAGETAAREAKVTDMDLEI